jgi:hypothetical protein
MIAPTMEHLLLQSNILTDHDEPMNGILFTLIILMTNLASNNLHLLFRIALCVIVLKLDQRVVNKDIQQGQNLFFVLLIKLDEIQQIDLEQRAVAKGSHGIDGVLCEPEGDYFGDRQVFALFENGFEIDQQDLAGALLE